METSIHSLFEGATQRPVRWRSSCVPRLHHWCRGLGEWGIEYRDGWNGRGSVVAPRRGIGQICFAKGARLATQWPSMGKFEAEDHRASTSATRRSRSPASISTARQPSSGPALVRRVSSQQAGPSGSTRPRWSRQRRPSAPFSRIHHSRSPSSPWALRESADSCTRKASEGEHRSGQSVYREGPTGMIGGNDSL
jgi:hypothetical protein